MFTVIPLSGIIVLFADILRSYVSWRVGTPVTQPTETRHVPDFFVLGVVIVGIEFPVVELPAAICTEIVIVAVAGDSHHKSLCIGTRIKALTSVVSASRTDRNPFWKSVFLDALKRNQLFLRGLPASFS